jgi:hypothetical protein
LRRSAQLDVVVLGQDDQPVGGAQVMIIEACGQHSVGRADEQGRFRIPAPVGETLTVSATDSTGTRSGKVADVSAGAARVIVRLLARAR